MNFLFPTFLIGLANSHSYYYSSFNFRKYKKVYFTNVQFLKELKQESDSKSKLKEWLILAMRILAIACLVFAFAQPFIPEKQKQCKVKKRLVFILITVLVWKAPIKRNAFRKMLKNTLLRLLIHLMQAISFS